MGLLRIIKNFFTSSQDPIKNITQEEKDAIKILMNDGMKSNTFIRHEVEIQRINKYINQSSQKGPK